MVYENTPDGASGRPRARVAPSQTLRESKIRRTPPIRLAGLLHVPRIRASRRRSGPPEENGSPPVGAAFGRAG